MRKEYPKFKRGEIEEFYKHLPRNEKNMLNDYLAYRKARGITSEEKLMDVRRYILHLRYILEKEFRTMNLKDLRSILALISSSRLSAYVKNTIKTDLKNFLKYLFPDWSLRFASLEDIKLISNPRNEKRLNSKALLQKEDIEKIMKHETKIFWKSFFIVQYEGALRTKETRFLKWEDIKFNVDGDISEISIYSTKTKKARTVFVKEATYYLSRLKEEQENLGKKGIYVFPSRADHNKPIDKATVSEWFRDLTKKVLGRAGWNYLLRHSRGTELYRLAKQGKIAKDTAIEFMGHSEDMSDVYSHFDKEEIKEMLKNQVYKLEEIPEEKKSEIEQEIERLKTENEKLKSGFEDKLSRLRKEQDEKILELSSEVKEMFGASKKSNAVTSFFLELIKEDKDVREKARRFAKIRSGKLAQSQSAHP